MTDPMSNSRTVARIFIHSSHQEVEFPLPSLFPVGSRLLVINSLYDYRTIKTHGLRSTAIPPRAGRLYEVDVGNGKKFWRASSSATMPDSLHESGTWERTIHFTEGDCRHVVFLPRPTMLDIGMRATVRNKTDQTLWADNWASVAPGMIEVFQCIINPLAPSECEWMRCTDPESWTTRNSGSTTDCTKCGTSIIWDPETESPPDFCQACIERGALTTPFQIMDADARAVREPANAKLKHWTRCARKSGGMKRGAEIHNEMLNSKTSQSQDFRIFITRPEQIIGFPVPEFPQEKATIRVVCCLPKHEVFRIEGPTVYNRFKVKPGYVTEFRWHVGSQQWVLMDDEVAPSWEVKMGGRCPTIDASDPTAELAEPTMQSIGMRAVIRNEKSSAVYISCGKNRMMVRAEPGTVTTVQVAYDSRRTPWGTPVGISWKKVKEDWFVGFQGADRSDATRDWQKLPDGIYADAPLQPADLKKLKRSQGRRIERTQMRFGKSAVAEAPAATPRMVVYCQNDEDGDI